MQNPNQTKLAQFSIFSPAASFGDPLAEKQLCPSLPVKTAKISRRKSLARQRAITRFFARSFISRRSLALAARRHRDESAYRENRRCQNTPSYVSFPGFPPKNQPFRWSGAQPRVSPHPSVLYSDSLSLMPLPLIAVFFLLSAGLFFLSLGPRRKLRRHDRRGK